jgi:hypothetical protein
LAAEAYVEDQAAVRWFTVHGVIDGTTVWAHWESGILACDDAVWQRVALATMVDDAFLNGGGWPPGGSHAGRSVHAGMVATALSLIRACDVVRSIDFGIDS